MVPQPASSFRPNRWVRSLLAAAVAVVAVGCGAPRPPSTTPPPVAVVGESPAPATLDAETFELRALLLLMADRRLYEPLAAGSAATHEDPEMRRHAALALGRVRDARVLNVLRLLVADDEASVRRAAAFALGELGAFGVRGTRAPLLAVVADSDRETSRRAIEALARTGVSLEDVVERLTRVPSTEILPRLAPALYRFESDGVVGWARQGLDSDDPELRRMAAYGLARNPRPAARDDLRDLLADPDPWIRGWAARALGRLGDRSDLARLRPLLDDAEPGPIVRALNAARALIADGRAAPDDAWRSRLLELLDDTRPGVRATAIEASSAWLLDEAIGSRLETFLGEGSARQRELALLALAEAGEPRVAAWLSRLASDPEPVVRAAAARAAALTDGAERVIDLSSDANPAVRRAAIELLLDLDPNAETAAGALRDSDPFVRAAVFGWLAEQPIVPIEVLAPAFVAALEDREVDARLAAVEALVARAENEPRERGALVGVLEKASEASDFLTRRALADGLTRLGRPAPALGTVDTGRTIEIYREIVRQTQSNQLVTVDTAHGSFELEIFCPEAPLTCLSFLQLVRQGFYDGLSCHRIVPDFVVQTGDPRGDGAGGPGYTLRDEPNLLRYDRGILGMARLGHDTAGSQWFVTLSRQPHLDGAYTAFGRVTRGMDVLDRLEQGDRITRVREVSR